MKFNNTQGSKVRFWNTGFCSFLIILFAFFFAFGTTCTVWKMITRSSSVVSDGNVFGYSIIDVHSNNYSPTFKAGNTTIAYHTDLQAVPSKGMIVYNVSNNNGMQYDVAQLVSINTDAHTITIKDNNGTRNINSSLYVGAVVLADSLTMGIIQVLNSNLMLWIFAVGGGVIFLTLLICRNRALRQ